MSKYKVPLLAFTLLAVTNCAVASTTSSEVKVGKPLTSTKKSSTQLNKARVYETVANALQTIDSTRANYEQSLSNLSRERDECIRHSDRACLLNAYSDVMKAQTDAVTNYATALNQLQESNRGMEELLNETSGRFKKGLAIAKQDLTALSQEDQQLQNVLSVADGKKLDQASKYDLATLASKVRTDTQILDVKLGRLIHLTDTVDVMKKQEEFLNTLGHAVRFSKQSVENNQRLVETTMNVIVARSNSLPLNSMLGGLDWSQPIMNFDSSIPLDLFESNGQGELPEWNAPSIDVSNPTDVIENISARLQQLEQKAQ